MSSSLELFIWTGPSRASTLSGLGGSKIGSGLVRIIQFPRLPKLRGHRKVQIAPPEADTKPEAFLFA
jgi:hypothetical protein